MAGTEDPVKNPRAVGHGSTAASSDEKAEATGNGDDAKAPGIKKWVEMPLEYIAWLLSQTSEDRLIAEIMADDEAWKEEFFAFQQWVRETFDQNGCVMVPEEFKGCHPGGLQELVDEAWEKGMRELEMIDGCAPFSREEEETAAALPSN